MVKPRKTMNQLLNEEVDSLKSQLGAMTEEFNALIPRDENKKPKLPDSPEDKKEFFVDLVCQAASTGMTKKQIIDNLKLLSWADSNGQTTTLGEKAATTIFAHAREAIRIEILAEEFPENKIGDDDTDVKRVATAFWGKQEVTKCQEITVPVVVVLNHKDAAAKYVEQSKLSKSIAGMERENTAAILKATSAVEKAESAVELATEETKAAANEALLAAQVELETAEKFLETHEGYLSETKQRGVIRDELALLNLDLRTTTFERMAKKLNEYFNVSEGPKRGRGANLYASIGSELDFDCLH